MKAPLYVFLPQCLLSVTASEQTLIHLCKHPFTRYKLMKKRRNTYDKTRIQNKHI